MPENNKMAYESSRHPSLPPVFHRTGHDGQPPIESKADTPVRRRANPLSKAGRTGVSALPSTTDLVPVPGENGRILEISPADPSQAGDYTVTVSNGDGSATSAAASLVVDAISYEKWLSQVPNATGGPVYEPLGDYNHDGVQNFLEFALGVPPGAASASGSLPFITRDAIGPVFVYHAANGIQPLTYRLMKSTDLMTWEEHVPAQGEVTTIDQGAFTEVQVRVPSTEPKLFLELEVGTQ